MSIRKHEKAKKRMVVYHNGKDVATLDKVDKLGSGMVVFRWVLVRGTSLNEEKKYEVIEFVTRYISLWKEKKDLYELYFIIQNGKRDERRSFIKLLDMKEEEVKKDFLSQFFTEEFLILLQERELVGYSLFDRERKKKEEQFIKNVLGSFKELEKEEYLNVVIKNKITTIDVYFFRKIRKLLIQKENGKYTFVFETEKRVIDSHEKNVITDAIRSMMDVIIKKERMKHVVKEEISYLFKAFMQNINEKESKKFWSGIRKNHTFEEIEKILMKYRNEKKRPLTPVLEKDGWTVIVFNEKYYAITKEEMFCLQGDSKEYVVKQMISYKEKIYLEML